MLYPYSQYHGWGICMRVLKRCGFERDSRRQRKLFRANPKAQTYNTQNLGKLLSGETINRCREWPSFNGQPNQLFIRFLCLLVSSLRVSKCFSSSPLLQPHLVILYCCRSQNLPISGLCGFLDVLQTCRMKVAYCGICSSASWHCMVLSLVN